VITNLTGHPAVILPNGFRPDDASLPTRKKPDVNDKNVQVEDEGGGPGTPVSLTFLGDLYGEAKLLAVAKAYQDATGFHLKHPKMEVPKTEEKKS
jgi:Asp-tRNA(Asn)/Glu-tRNA(Gln) amidotransferase A subunit family amidase